jgi:hypothetical protein
MSWELSLVVSGVVGIIDGRLGFAALLICGLLGLLA